MSMRVNMKQIKKFIFILACFVSTDLFSQEINRISISAPKTIDQIHLKRLIGIKEGDSFRPSVLDGALSRLAAAEDYKSIKADYNEESKILEIVLLQYPKVSKTHIKILALADPYRQRLKKDIESFLTEARMSVYRSSQIDNLKRSITGYLNQLGYEAAKINIQENKNSLDDSSVDLNLEITIKKLNILKQIDFVGFNQKQVKDFLSIFRKKKKHKGTIKTKLYKQSEFSFYKKLNSWPLNQFLIEKQVKSFRNRLRKEKYFNANLSYKVTEKSKLVLTLKSGKKIRINIVGNRHFWENSLRNSIEKKYTKAHLTFNVKDVQDMLKGRYLKEGFIDFESIVSEKIKKDTRYIQIRVNEGKQYFLGDILISGANLSKKQAFEWERKLKKSWYKAFSKITFSWEDLKQKISSLEGILLQEGYAKAEISEINQGKADLQKNKIDLLVRIDLGTKYRIAEISFLDGLSVKPTNKLSSELKKGDLLDVIKLASWRSQILNFYQNLGFLNASLNSLSDSIKFRDFDALADLELSLNLGERVKLGKLIVLSEGKTKKEVIEREYKHLKNENQEWWTSDFQDEFKRRILGLGIFSSVKLSPLGGRFLPYANSDYLVTRQDLKADLVERAGGSIEFGPGFRSDLGLVFSTSYIYRNIRGWNQSIRLKAQISRKVNNYQFVEQSYSMRYLSPYTFGRKIRFKLDLSYFKNDENVFNAGSRVSGYNEENFKLSTGVDYQLSRSWRWIHNLYSLEIPNFKDVFNQPVPLPSKFRTPRIATMGSQLEWDKRDNIFNPRKGFLNRIGFEYANKFIGSTDTVHFLSTFNELTFYLPLNKYSRIKTNFNYRWLWKLGSQYYLPINKRLYLGGVSSLRFLDKEAIGSPVDDFNTQESIELSVELLQYVMFNFGFAVFYQGGYLNNFSFGDSGWRQGLGTGLRYKTPVGPISLDLAWNIRPQALEERFKLIFSIGEL